jgi:mycothiol system anti-sigma-R factor
VLERIELYLDGELDPALGAELEAHLSGCGPCASHSEFQRRLKALLREKCGCDEVPAELLERIRAIYAEPAP